MAGRSGDCLGIARVLLKWAVAGDLKLKVNSMQRGAVSRSIVPRKFPKRLGLIGKRRLRVVTSHRCGRVADDGAKRLFRDVGMETITLNVCRRAQRYTPDQSNSETWKSLQRCRFVAKVSLTVATSGGGLRMTADRVEHLLRYTGAVAELFESVPPRVVRL